MKKEETIYRIKGLANDCLANQEFNKFMQKSKKCVVCGELVYKVYKGKYQHFKERFNNHEIVLEGQK